MCGGYSSWRVCSAQNDYISVLSSLGWSSYGQFLFSTPASCRHRHTLWFCWFHWSKHTNIGIKFCWFTALAVRSKKYSLMRAVPEHWTQQLQLRVKDDALVSGFFADWCSPAHRDSRRPKKGSTDVSNPITCPATLNLLQGGVKPHDRIIQVNGRTLPPSDLLESVRGDNLTMFQGCNSWSNKRHSNSSNCIRCNLNIAPAPRKICCYRT